MIYCPNCQSQELMGALFCSNCGAALINIEQVRQEEDVEGSSRSSVIEQNNSFNHSPFFDEEAKIYLQILENGELLPLSGRREFTLGRVHDDQPIIPDIDMNPYGGFEEGVSRLHATIQIDGKGVTVTDLGSVNGTFVNGEDIADHKPRRLSDGDILTLGKMNMKVFIRN